MKYTLKDDFGPHEIYDAFQMISSDMKEHGNSPNWSGWPDFIQEAMKHQPESNSSIWIQEDGNLGIREYEGDYLRTINDKDWIIRNRHGDLYLLENQVFKEDFMRF